MPAPPDTRWLTEPLRGHLAALQRLAQARGCACYLVGGVLRDTYAPTPTVSRNVDLACPSQAQALARAVAAETRGTLVPLDEEVGAYRVVIGHEAERYELDLNDFRAPTIEGD